LKIITYQKKGGLKGSGIGRVLPRNWLKPLILLPIPTISFLKFLGKEGIGIIIPLLEGLFGLKGNSLKALN